LGSAVLLLGASGQAALGLSAEAVSRIAQDITVRIDGQNPGSGVLIEQEDDTYTILTAAHVVATEDEYEIITPDEKRHPLSYGRVTKIPDVDLALVQFDSPDDYSVAKMGKSEKVARGESVFVAGFPMTNYAITQPVFNVSPGAITAHAKNKPLSDGYGLVYTNRTLPGMSGGAVLNEKGKLIGIHGRADTEQSIQETETIYLKTGFNLGIPLYTFLGVSSTLSPSPEPEASAEDWYLAGGHKSQQQDYEGAIADIDKAIDLEPEFGEAYYRRYYAREQLGDPQAEDDLQQAIALLNRDLDQAEDKLKRIDALIENLEQRLWQPNGT
ncbi:MAG: trypsin-like peptidase domain-containing protein, partial [Cyanobacteria bacterium P01_F01_bin.42]